MQATRHSRNVLVLLIVFLFGLSVSSFALSDADQASAVEELKTSRAKVAEAQTAKEEAQKTRDALAAQQASKPNVDTERKLQDADYEVMMADSKLSSATKAVERAQKKLGENPAAPAVVKVEKPVVSDENKKATEEQARKEAEAKVAAQKTASEEAAKKIAEEQTRKEAEAKVAAQKASEEAAKKVAEEQAHKEAEAKVAAQKAASEEAAKKIAEEQAHKEAEAKIAAQKAASEEEAKKVADAEAAAKKQALAAELGIDKNCIALPGAPTNPAASLSTADLQSQAYAQGALKQVNQLVAKKAPDDVPPLSPSPVLEGSKLNPCDPNQKQALKFGYMGNGQYRVETPVLAGEQTFTIKNVVQPLNRTIPDADNGEVYVFFLDGREGRTQLSAYKKSLFEQAPQP